MPWVLLRANPEEGLHRYVLAVPLTPNPSSQGGKNLRAGAEDLRGGGQCTKTPTTGAASPRGQREWETFERIWCDVVSPSIPNTQGCMTAA